MLALISKLSTHFRYFHSCICWSLFTLTFSLEHLKNWSRLVSELTERGWQIKIFKLKKKNSYFLCLKPIWTTEKSVLHAIFDCFLLCFFPLTLETFTQEHFPFRLVASCSKSSRIGQDLAVWTVHFILMIFVLAAGNFSFSLKKLSFQNKVIWLATTGRRSGSNWGLTPKPFLFSQAPPIPKFLIHWPYSLSWCLLFFHMFIQAYRKQQGKGVRWLPGAIVFMEVKQVCRKCWTYQLKLFSLVTEVSVWARFGFKYWMWSDCVLKLNCTHSYESFQTDAFRSAIMD